MKTINDQPVIRRLLDRLTRAEQLTYLDALLAKAMPIPITGCYAWLGYDSGNGSDHTCRVRCCINPDHTEPATVRDNTLRGSAVL